MKDSRGAVDASALTILYCRSAGLPLSLAKAGGVGGLLAYRRWRGTASVPQPRAPLMVWYLVSSVLGLVFSAVRRVWWLSHSYVVLRRYTCELSMHDGGTTVYNHEITFKVHHIPQKNPAPLAQGLGQTWSGPPNGWVGARGVRI